MKIHRAVSDAYRVVEAGESLPEGLAYELAELVGEDVLDLVSLAHKVQSRRAAGVETCSILSARTGSCGEGCRFCAQSAHHATGADNHELMSPAEIVERAREAHDHGVGHFCIVTSGRGHLVSTPEFEDVCEAIEEVRAAVPRLSVCASLGILSDETASRLARTGIAHYNINLQVPPGRYSELVTDTHPVEERMATIRRMRARGILVCSGGILGLGETMRERVELAFALRALDVEIIPLNVLIPIPGTPLADRPLVRAMEAAKTFAVFRLVHPTRLIKFAAGRETIMKDFQGLLMLAGANGLITGGYLTTRGRSVADDKSFVDELSLFRS